MGLHINAEVDLGSFLESELGQKWRYGALKHVYAKSSLSKKNLEFKGLIKLTYLINLSNC